jgi:hypothetical protein
MFPHRIGLTVVAVPTRQRDDRIAVGRDRTTDSTGARRESDVLSEHEARALRQIEQQPAADDPRLAARMSREHTGPDAAAGQPYGS